VGPHAVARDAAGAQNRVVLSEEGLGAILPSLTIFGRSTDKWNSKGERARSALERSRRRTPSSSATSFSVISIVGGLVF
jgi:hypothetical protein